MSKPDGTATAGSGKQLLGVLNLSKPIGQMTEAELDEVAAEVEKERQWHEDAR